MRGQTVGRLTVIERAEPGYRGTTRWVCRCECGTVKTFYACNIRAGYTTSCGCVHRETMQRVLTTHGVSDKSGPRFSDYQRWSNMRRRCNDPRNQAYKNYGGRGISVFPAWEDFATFDAWVQEHLGPCPEGWTLDRIKNDGNYEPGNVRWASYKTQANNTRRNKPKIAA
jgi:hypothetical protein